MTTEANLKVEGMDCAACESRLSTSLSRLEGVIRAKADARSGRVEVRFDPDRVSEQAIRDRIRDSGFDAAKD